MTTFWMLFWIAFYLTPLLYFLSRAIISRGQSSSGSHIWVSRRSGARVRDATQKEVWERSHPGKSWDESQERFSIGCLVVLLLGLVGGLAFMAHRLLPLPEAGFPRIFRQFGSTLIGMLAGGAYWTLLLGFLWKLHYPVTRVLRWIALVAGPILVAGFAALELVDAGFEIPFSHHWIWLSPVLVAAFSQLDRSTFKGEKDSAVRGGNRLGTWALDMVMVMLDRGLSTGGSFTASSIRDDMEALQALINRGEMDDLVRNWDWFRRSEGLLVDLISGQPMAITEDEIYQARDEIVRAVQTYYFRAVRLGAYVIDPRIEAALKK